MEPNTYNITWKSHSDYKSSIFFDFLSQNQLIDVILVCDGKKIGAHKIVLSACSLYFREVFATTPNSITTLSPLVVVVGIKLDILHQIIRFMYTGQVEIESDKLEEFRNAGQLLKVCGLLDDADKSEIPPGMPAAIPDENSPSTSETTSEEEAEQNEAPIQGKATKGKKAKTNKKQPRTRKRKIDTAEEPVKEEEGEITSVVKVEPEELMENEQIAQEIESDIKNFTASSNPIGQIEANAVILPAAILPSAGRKKGKKLNGFSEKSLVCMKCDKRFEHPYSLQHHRAVHLGITKCPICFAVLSRKYNLKMHMKARHRINV